jgi:hypothetical protein
MGGRNQERTGYCFSSPIEKNLSYTSYVPSADAEDDAIKGTDASKALISDLS